MERTNFENLEIYQLSENLADEIWGIVIGWNNLAQDTVGKQIIRSTDSIGANIAESSGRGSNQDYIRFLRIACGSYTKRDIGCAALTNENFYQMNKSLS